MEHWLLHSLVAAPGDQSGARQLARSDAGNFANLLPALVFGGLILLVMDTSFNITMQPFRSLVGDMVNDEQKNLGYSLQSALINFGAVFGSLLPWILVALAVWWLWKLAVK